MNKCPLTYQPCGGEKYSGEGLRKLSRYLTDLHDFPYSAFEIRQTAAVNMKKMSIQGVQPKVSALLNIKKQTFEIVETGGLFIIKPQHDHFPQMPENEDLTMKMAALTGIETPLHGLIWCSDGTLSYFIKRFDRIEKKNKLPLEDFGQLAQLPPEQKYDYTLEKTVKIIETYCTFPVIEKRHFFKRILFSFLTGNEDMHLKNFSLITRNNRVELSPAYDLLNSTILLGPQAEESALMLAGKRKNLSKRDLVDYFGGEKLGLNSTVIAAVLGELSEALPQWETLIGQSFLSVNARVAYLDILKKRCERLFN